MLHKNYFITVIKIHVSDILRLEHNPGVKGDFASFLKFP